MPNRVSNFCCTIFPCFKKDVETHSPALQGFSLKNIHDLDPYACITYDEFAREFMATYGKRLLEEVEKDYGIFKVPYISAEEVKQRLIGIAARVKKEDLVTLFDSIVDGDYDLGCVRFLSRENIDHIEKFLNFEELGDNELEILTAAFRYFPNKTGEMQAVGSLFFSLKEFRKIPAKWPSAFRNHLTMVRAFERCDHFIQDANAKYLDLRRELAHTEHLAREIAYGIPLNETLSHNISHAQKNQNLTPIERLQRIDDLVKEQVVGTIFPTLNEKGEKVFYEIKSSFFYRGLVAFFCAPFTNGQWVSKNSADPSPFPVKAIFRGTWCKSSLQRDFEGLEAGCKSFFELSGELITQLENCIPKHAGEVYVDTMGHSLGGNDGERFAKLMAEIRATRLTESGLHESATDKVTRVRVYTWNSPGLKLDTIQEYNEHVIKIKYSQHPIQFHHTHVLVGEDIFQIFGEGLLGFQDPKLHPDPQNIINENTRIVKFVRGDIKALIGTTLKAHTRPCLSVDAKNPKMKVRTKNINRQLGPKSALDRIKMLAKAIFRRLKRLSKQIASLFICTKKNLTNPDHLIHQVFTQRALRRS